MKKIILITFSILFFIALFLVADRFVIGEDKPKTERELKDIADVKYYKKIGEPFDVNDFKLTVVDFALPEIIDNADLTINISIKNRYSESKVMPSIYLKLYDEMGQNFISEPIDSVFEGSEERKVALQYKLPTRILPYFLYRLHVVDPDKPETKGIFVISKNFRSNG